MRRLCDKLLSSLNISGRDLAVFLLSLLLAFSIWLIHNLALKYNSYLDVAVRAKCSIDGYAEQSSDYCNVVARCRATGYNVIRTDMRRGRRIVDVQFQPSVMKHKEGNIFYVTSADLQEYSHLIYGDGVTVEYFTTDTLFFRFAYENSRRVPVLPVTSISFEPQYTEVDPIKITPDSVTVYGDPSLLENMEGVFTRPLKFSHLSSDIQGDVDLEKIRGVRYSEEKVRYSLDVSRYVELKGTFSVMMTNVPSDKSVKIYPSKVDVYLKCTFPYSGDPVKESSVMVDYNDFLQSVSGKCVVDLSTRSKDIIDYEVSPSSVECVVEDIM